MSKSAHFGVLPFCFVVELKCHRHMLEFVTQPKHITGCDVGLFKSGTFGYLLTSLVIFAICIEIQSDVIKL